jgi:hypothetical protein
MFTEMRIRKRGDDGALSDLVADEQIAPIQMIGGTFIKNLKVTINGREIYDSNGNYIVYFFSRLTSNKNFRTLRL